jgi:hypothetical protein
MKKSLKKIVLSRETLRHLSGFEVAEVQGAISTNPCTNTSDYRSCGPYSVTVCPPGTGC